MQPDKKRLRLKVAGFSALAGMRSMSGPALISLDRKLVNESSVAGKIFRSPYVFLGANVLALGEMFADKLPFLPNRTSFPALCARAVSGAVIGASIYSQHEESAVEGALLGGASAVAATYVSYHVRRVLTKNLHIPDFLVALAEDSFIVAKGMKILEQQIEPPVNVKLLEAQVPGNNGMMHS